MEIKDVYELLDKINNTDFTEVKLNFNDLHLVCKRQKPQQILAVESVQSTEDVQPELSKRDTAFVEKQPVEVAKKDDIEYIKAPLVGTFYRASEEGAKPYVSVSQEVKKGDVIGIIEAMKLMNEITATCDGVVESILAEDATFVEFGQELIAVKKG